MRTFAKFADFSRATFKGIVRTGFLALGFVSLFFASAPIITTTGNESDGFIAHADAPSCSCACSEGGCSCDGGSAGDGASCGGCGGCSSSG